MRGCIKVKKNSTHACQWAYKIFSLRAGEHLRRLLVPSRPPPFPDARDGISSRVSAGGRGVRPAVASPRRADAFPHAVRRTPAARPRRIASTPTPAAGPRPRRTPPRPPTRRPRCRASSSRSCPRRRRCPSAARPATSRCPTSCNCPAREPSPRRRSPLHCPTRNTSSVKAASACCPTKFPSTTAGASPSASTTVTPTTASRRLTATGRCACSIPSRPASSRATHPSSGRIFS